MRLNNQTLRRVSPDVLRPSCDRAALTTGIVHLGLGAFHRAHQAVYTEAALAEDASWGILGASLRSPETRDALGPQDGLYCVAARGVEGARLQVIGASTGILVAPENPEALLSALAAPATRIVTLTITEKGYSLDPATSALKLDDPGIRRDLEHPETPTTAIGFLGVALARRRRAGLKPFVALSCDNLPANGHALRGAILAFAAAFDMELMNWLDGELRCPSTMVDRIVPATTAADRAEVEAALGFEDAWPIATERFSQWVIEDDFPLGRPAWELGGAELVNDVKPYELLKLRTLNGAHSTLAYLGYLMDAETVAEAMAEPDLAELVRAMMVEEISPTLPALAGFDLDAYRKALLARFRNPALKHRTWQIAMDGSQKLPQRLLGTIRARLSVGAPFPRLALGVAAWIRYCMGVDEKGRPIDVRDAMSARLRELADSAGRDAHRLVEAFLGLRSVFGDDLPKDPVFRAAVEDKLASLLALGAAAAVRATR
jgi:fructuronate reductase